ncbi:MAG: SLC13 family permease [Phycisphaerae bacterium]
MTLEAWLTIGVIVVAFVSLARNFGPPDLVLFGSAVVLAIVGVISPTQLLHGFGEPAVITVVALIIVSAALRETGLIDRVGHWAFSKTNTEKSFFARLAGVTLSSSAFVNNTAVVAMMINIVADWCKRNGVSPSRLMMPLSFMTILGGMCTLIGTSTNLIVNGLLKEADHAPMKFLDLAWVGVPIAVGGTLLLYFICRGLVPERRETTEHRIDASREFLTDMRIEPECRLVGQTVEEAALRNLPGLFLIEIIRHERIIAPVGPDEILRAGDRLTFTGVISTIVDLERIPGFVPAGNDKTDDVARGRRRFCEAVVSSTSPLIGSTIRESNFRARYNAAVLAVHRGGTRLRGRIGDIEIEPGDTLLLQTGPHFDVAHRNNPDFYLVSGIEEMRPARHQFALISGLLLLCLVIVLSVFSNIPTVIPALTVAGLMVLLRCISATDARRAIPVNLVIAIAGALALGKAVDASGLATSLAHWVANTVGAWGPHAALAAIFLLTMFMTEIVTNNAAAALAFPLALKLADELQVDVLPFSFAITYAASASFLTPFGYQTNMMVYGPGGYRFTDFVRVGLPLSIFVGIVCVLLIPVVWPFTTA